MSNPFRSLLSVPAVRPEFYAKAAASDVDTVMVDLEDSVFPERKDEARTLLTQALQEVDWRGKPVLARVNAIGTEWGFADLIGLGLKAPNLSGFMVPKVETVDELRYLEQVLNGLDGMRCSGRPLELHLLIETALGVANAERIVQAATRLQSVTIGLGDYAMSLGLAGGLGEGAQAGGSVSPLVDTWHFAMARVANACHAYGVRPIDAPYGQFTNPEGLRASIRRGQALGFTGKWALHPTHIEPINLAYSPTEAQVHWAHRVKAALDEARAAGKGAARLDGALIEAATMKVVDRILSIQPRSGQA